MSLLASSAIAAHGADHEKGGSDEITGVLNEGALAPLRTAVAADTLLAYYDPNTTTSSETYVKLRELTVPAGISGTLRIKFTLISSNTHSISGRIYRNGAGVGSPQTCTTNTPGVEYSEDIAGWSEGDLIQIYGKRNATNGVTLEKVRVYAITPPDDAAYGWEEHP